MFFLLKQLSRLPLPILYFFAGILSLFLRIFYRRRLVRINIQRALPDAHPQLISKIAIQFYKRFSDILVEVLKARTISRKELDRRIRFINPEITFELQKENKPLLFFASHQCNWEWMAQASGIKLSVPGDVIYKPLDNKQADAFSRKIRSRFGGNPIPKDSAAREILQSKNQHRIIGLVADQSPPRNHVYWAKFLGLETDFYPGLVQLPYLMQAEAVFGRITREKRGYYNVELVPIGHPPYEKGDTSVLRRYIEEVEKLITENPADYLWSHNRWKHTRMENEEMINFS